jgi:CRISPR-associated protein Csb1
MVILSPASLIFGAWDATRKSNQGRWPSVITGETIGVLADQDRDPEALGKGGARVDPVGMSIKLAPADRKAIADRQRAELSKETYDSFVKKDQASVLGFGGIPPSLSQLGLVACRSITRSRVLSFAILRQMRFGRDAQGDAAIRAALAALAINGIVRSDAELFLRSHCHLIEAGPTLTQIDRRHGRLEQIELPTISEADSLLQSAIDHAAQVGGLDWHGQVLEVEGNPVVLAGASSESTED